MRPTIAFALALLVPSSLPGCTGGEQPDAGEIDATAEAVEAAEAVPGGASFTTDTQVVALPEPDA